MLLSYGTRPEVIKMAPVIRALEARPDRFEVCLCCTAQHRELIDDVQLLFGLRPDHDLDLMRPDQSLNDLASRALTKLSATEPASDLEQLVLQAMRQTAKVLESAHASIALQQSTCHHLWEHLNGLGALMRMIGSVEGGAPSAAGAPASRVPEVVRE